MGEDGSSAGKKDQSWCGWINSVFLGAEAIFYFLLTDAERRATISFVVNDM